MTGRERLRLLLQGAEADDALLDALIDEARQTLLNLTGRAELPPALVPCAVRLALALFNRLGAEGEAGRREGGLSVRWDDLPELVKSQLRPYRAVKIG